MPQAHSRQADRYAQLYAKYRFEWRAFAQETRRWRLLEEEGQTPLATWLSRSQAVVQMLSELSTRGIVVRNSLFEIW